MTWKTGGTGREQGTRNAVKGKSSGRTRKGLDYYTLFRVGSLLPGNYQGGGRFSKKKKLFKKKSQGDKGGLGEKNCHYSLSGGGKLLGSKREAAKRQEKRDARGGQTRNFGKRDQSKLAQQSKRGRCERKKKKRERSAWRGGG